MVRILLLFSKLAIILTSILFYSWVFREFQDKNIIYFHRALQQTYQILGKDHDLTVEQKNYNAHVCQKQDYYKYTHPDVVLEDVYCFRLVRDTMTYTYNKKCFAIAHHKGPALDDAFRKISISHKLIKQEDRKKFMASRCVFTTNLALHPGHICAKSFLHQKQSEYRQKLIQRNASQQCLQDLDYFPVSYGLHDEQECRIAFQLLHEKFTEQGSLQYIVKTNYHQGKGLLYVDDTFYQQLMKTYQNGSLCGTIPQKQILQELTQKPILYKGHKIDFRIWIIIVQTDPLILYVYEYTTIMACLEGYNVTNLNQYNFNCNAGLAKEYWKNKKQGAETPFTLAEVHMGWSFKDWGNYFKSLGLVHSDDWWETTLLPLFEQKITYFMKIVLSNVRSDQRLSGLFALDGILDQDLNLKIIDFNSAPEFVTITRGMTFVQTMLHVDTFNLLGEYLHQRYRKLINHINNVLIPKMKKGIPIDVAKLTEVLRVEPLSQKKSFQFYQINQEQAVKNCKAYDEEL